MLHARTSIHGGRSGAVTTLVCLLIFVAGSCGDDNPVAPPVVLPDNMGAMPAVPRPTSLTTEAQSDTVTVIKPLKVAYAPRVHNALADWRIGTQSCTEEVWIEDCGGWSSTDYAGTWLADLPAKSGYRPPTPFKLQLMADNGEKIEPAAYSHRKNSLNHRRCGFLDCCYCWYNAIWSASPPQLTGQPYLCRDRFWVVAGKSQILPQGFSQEITTTVVHGVEKTECDEWAVSVTIEGEVQNGYASLKSSIEASYSKTVTKTVFEETSVETKYTPERVPDGKQAIYQVWVLVDRYTLTDKNGTPFTDPNYAFGPTRRVHVQGVWEAHAITYFTANTALSIQTAR